MPIDVSLSVQATRESFVIETSDDDELDFLSGATSPTLVGSATPLSSLEEGSLGKRSVAGTGMKLRKKEVKVVEALLPRKHEKRKRTQSESKVQKGAAEALAKRLKLDDKVAHTAELNKRRIRVENARHRWVQRHRKLFEPLLPESSNYFNTLEKEIKVANDRTPYFPLHELDEQPKLIKGGEMKDYQLHGLSFLVYMYRNGMNCILGDEMGLGKTLQTLSLFAYIAEHEISGSMDPHLIICPLSVLSAWMSEVERWVPTFKAIRFHGSANERARMKVDIREGKLKFDVCIATYESYVAEDTWFKSKQWSYVVLDEGHRIKNSETNVAGKLQGLGSLFKMILTGTPIQNNLVELWGLLHWLYPKIFTAATERLFKDSWDLSRGSYSTSFLNAANKLLTTVMLRRTKSVVECSVPPKEELTVFLPMTEAQRFWTLGLLTRLDVEELEKIFQTEVKGEDDSQELIANMKQGAKQGLYKRLQNLLLQLRMVCDHPYLLPDAEPTPFVLGEHIVASSAKLTLVDKLLADLLPKGDRVLIFSQWTGMLDLLEDFMNLRGIPYARLDGSTSRPRRTLDIRLFQRDDSPYKVFLISTRAGGLGINLTKASHVIMFDSDWNPQNDIQAIARAHRIGQTKIVKVYRLICQGSVEDQMLDRIRRKLFLSVKIMGSSNDSTDPTSDTEGTNSSVSELMDILRRGSSSLMMGGGGMSLRHFLKADIKEILRTSKERDDARVMKMKKEMGDDDAAGQDTAIAQRRWEEEEQELLSGVAQVQSRLFEGKVVQRAKPQHQSPGSGPLKGLGPSKASVAAGSLNISKSSKQNRAMAEEWKAVQLQAGKGEDGVVTVNGLEVDTAFIGEVIEELPKPIKKPRKKAYNHEDWCIHCRDGGDLVCCSYCPRVFHPMCVGMSKAVAARTPFLTCLQHDCISCGRNTTDSGGMLFRCQTCPQAFCEDCLPFDDIKPVGPIIPEFRLCSWTPQATAYFIRCADCLSLFKEQPKIWNGWVKEWADMERRIESMESSEDYVDIE
ncbi:P-loop containing nucleoside triphosphate hydrolase protein [Cristinia sonorae]|uniref:P-loop containing nucleoside triphosphate hydrolase protein n=1 Tax=Cristinia sonorae TaxID=1940300 RepID=A0A8K0UJE5_9AGAR|nr:P-loop containing nucleoside triphosphate hydrolase protein [Cristinia sonorae]